LGRIFYTISQTQLIKIPVPFVLGFLIRDKRLKTVSGYTGCFNLEGVDLTCVSPAAILNLSIGR
jgi:hypothetical protein